MLNSKSATLISQTDPKANYLAHQTAIDAAIRRVLDSGWYILGQEVEAFEAEFATYIGTPHAIGVGNGTDEACHSVAQQRCRRWRQGSRTTPPLGDEPPQHELELIQKLPFLDSRSWQLAVGKHQ